MCSYTGECYDNTGGICAECCPDRHYDHSAIPRYDHRRRHCEPEPVATRVGRDISGGVSRAVFDGAESAATFPFRAIRAFAVGFGIGFFHPEIGKIKKKVLG